MAPGTAFLLSILILLGMRGFFGLHLSSFQSRKAVKAYKANVPFFDRWFFLSAPDYVRDKYSKLERKVIKARAFVRAMRVMNFLLHGLLLPLTAILLLHALNMASDQWIDMALTVYAMAGGICFMIVCVVDMCHHREAERVRNGRKRIEW